MDDFVDEDKGSENTTLPVESLTSTSHQEDIEGSAIANTLDLDNDPLVCSDCDITKSTECSLKDGVYFSQSKSVSLVEEKVEFNSVQRTVTDSVHANYELGIELMLLPGIVEDDAVDGVQSQFTEVEGDIEFEGGGPSHAVSNADKFVISQSRVDDSVKLDYPRYENSLNLVCLQSFDQNSVQQNDDGVKLDVEPNGESAKLYDLQQEKPIDSICLLSPDQSNVEPNGDNAKLDDLQMEKSPDSICLQPTDQSAAGLARQSFSKADNDNIGVAALSDTAEHDDEAEFDQSLPAVAAPDVDVQQDENVCHGSCPQYNQNVTSELSSLQHASSTSTDFVPLDSQLSEVSQNADGGYTCYICGKRFSSWSICNKHQQLHLTKPHYCKMCNLFFRTSSNFAVHLKLHNKLYRCNRCGKCLLGVSSFRHHAHIHSDVRPFSSSDCEMLFKYKNCLTSHRTKHCHTRAQLPPDGEKTRSETVPELVPNMQPNTSGNVSKYKCHICGRQFAAHSRRLFNRHLHRHTLRPDFCKLCCRSFKNASSLSLHLKLHGRRRPMCSICGKSFARSRNLERHMVTHSGTKPFGCSACGVRFTQKTDLGRHQRKHCRVSALRTADAELTGRVATPEAVPDIVTLCIVESTASFLPEASEGVEPDVAMSHNSHMDAAIDTNNSNAVTMTVDGGDLNTAAIDNRDSNPVTMMIVGSADSNPETIDIDSSDLNPAANDTKYLNPTNTSTGCQSQDQRAASNEPGPANCGRQTATSSRVVTRPSSNVGWKFVCKTCGKRCQNANNLKSHMASHWYDKSGSSKRKSKSLPQTVITAGTGSSSYVASFQSDIQYSSSIQPPQLSVESVSNKSCHICGGLLRNDSELSAHLMLHYRGLQMQKDTQCVGIGQLSGHASSMLGKQFSKNATVPQNSNSPNWNVSSSVKQFLCLVCYEGFNTNECIATHVQSHVDLTTFLCHPCGSVFPNVTVLGLHMITCHTRSRMAVSDIDCDSLGAIPNRISTSTVPSTTVGGLSTAAIPATDSSFPCSTSPTGTIPQCATSYQSDSNDGRPAVNHTQQLDAFTSSVIDSCNNGMQRVCVTCGKGFRRSTLLAVHVWNHMVEKSLSCQLCNRSHESVSQLRQHERVVHGLHTGNSQAHSGMELSDVACADPMTVEVASNRMIVPPVAIPTAAASAGATAGIVATDMICSTSPITSPDLAAPIGTDDVDAVSCHAQLMQNFRLVAYPLSSSELSDERFVEAYNHASEFSVSFLETSDTQQVGCALFGFESQTFAREVRRLLRTVRGDLNVRLLDRTENIQNIVQSLNRASAAVPVVGGGSSQTVNRATDIFSSSSNILATQEPSVVPDDVDVMLKAYEDYSGDDPVEPADIQSDPVCTPASMNHFPVVGPPPLQCPGVGPAPGMAQAFVSGDGDLQPGMGFLGEMDGSVPGILQTNGSCPPFGIGYGDVGSLPLAGMAQTSVGNASGPGASYLAGYAAAQHLLNFPQHPPLPLPTGSPQVPVPGFDSSSVSQFGSVPVYRIKGGNYVSLRTSQSTGCGLLSSATDTHQSLLPVQQEVEHKWMSNPVSIPKSGDTSAGVDSDNSVDSDVDYLQSALKLLAKQTDTGSPLDAVHHNPLTSRLISSDKKLQQRPVVVIKERVTCPTSSFVQVGFKKPVGPTSRPVNVTPEKRFKCVYCDKRFTRHHNQRVHEINKHEDVSRTTAYSYKCVPCGRLFLTACRLTEHELAAHRNAAENLFGCPFSTCGLKFVDREALILHMTSQHGAVFENTCD